jgi:hypothetical protein
MPLEDTLGELFERAGLDPRVSQDDMLERLSRKAMAPPVQRPAAAPYPDTSSAPKPATVQADDDPSDKPLDFSKFGKPVLDFSSQAIPAKSAVPLPPERPAAAPPRPVAAAPLPPGNPTPPDQTAAVGDPMGMGAVPDPAVAAQGVDQIKAGLAKPADPNMPGIASAGLSGAADSIRQVVQSGQAVAGAPLTPIQQNPAAAPLGLEDVAHPIASGLPKLAYMTGQMLPGLALGTGGAVVGGAIGTAAAPGPGTAAGALIGGAGGMALAGAAQTLGPYFDAEMKKNPEDPEGAWDRALKAAEVAGAFSGASWAAFPIKFFNGPIKNLMFQAFDVQPGIAMAHKATSNVMEGKPADEGLGEAYVSGAIGTAAPMLAHHGVKAAFGRGEAAAAEPGQPGADGTTESVDDFLARERGRATRADIDDFLKQKAAAEAGPSEVPQLPAPADHGNYSSTSPGGPSNDRGPDFSGGATKVADVERSVLRDYGYTEDQIGQMSDQQRRSEYHDAVESGIKPPEREGTGTRQDPIVVKTDADVQRVGDVINKSPTDGQAQAENFQHEHVEVPSLGLTGKNMVAVETAAQGIRKGEGPDGTPWQVTMPVPYGRIKGTKGADGEPLDIFLGPKLENNPNVYVLDQKDPATGKFDEHKILAGFQSPFDAIETYLGAHDHSGPARIQNLTAFTPEQFQAWRTSADLTKPAAETAPAIISASSNEGGKTDTTAKATPNYSDPIPEGAKAPAVDLKVNKPAQAKGPLTMAQYLASKGGLKPDGDLHALGLTSKTRVVVPGMGYRGIVRGGGMTMDEAVQALREGGFLPPYDPNKPEAFDVHNDIREGLDEELNRGRPVRARGEETVDHDVGSARDIERGQEQVADAIEDMHSALEASGVPVSSVHPDDVRRAAEIMLREGLEPDEAFEKAVMANALEDETLTPTELDGIYGEGAADEVSREPAPTDGEAAQAEGGQRAEPTAAAELPEKVEQLPRRGEDGEQRGLEGHADESRAEHSGEPDAARASGPEREGADRAAAEAGPAGRDLADGAREAAEPRAAEHDGGKPADFQAAEAVAEPKFAISNVSSRRTEPVEAHNGKYKGFASTNDGGFLSVHAYGDSSADAQQKAITTLKKEFAERAEKRATEATAAGEQHVIPGAEKIGQGEQAQRAADDALKPKAPQQPADEGLFGDGHKQTDLLDMAEMKGRGAKKDEPDQVEAPGSDAKIDAQESANGLQGDVPAGDAGAGTGDVQAPDEARAARSDRRRGLEAGEPAVPAVDGESAEGRDGLSEAAVRAGGGGAGEGGAAGLPGERGDVDAAGRGQLAKYVGWGGIKGAFPDADGKFGKGFEEIGAKLKELLSARRIRDRAPLHPVRPLHRRKRGARDVARRRAAGLQGRRCSSPAWVSAISPA